VAAAFPEKTGPWGLVFLFDAFFLNLLKNLIQFLSSNFKFLLKFFVNPPKMQRRGSPITAARKPLWVEHGGFQHAY
jgi:hypothetical protein